MVKTSFLLPSWSMENIGHRDIATGSQFLVLFNFFPSKRKVLTSLNQNVGKSQFQLRKNRAGWGVMFQLNKACKT